MIKYLFFLVFLVPAGASLRNVLVPKVSSLEGSFFYLNDITLITEIVTKSPAFFQIKEGQDIVGIKKVSVSFLKPLGLGLKNIISFVDFNSGKSKKYTLGKEVFILIFETENSNPYIKEWTFNLILSDDPMEHKRLLNLKMRNSIVGSGLAYIGSDFEFTNGQYRRMRLERVPRNKELNALFLSPRDEISMVNIGDLKVFIGYDKESPWNESIVRLGKSNYAIDPIAIKFEKTGFAFYLGEFNPKYQFFISLIYPGPKCSNLNLILNNELTVKPIHCIRKSDESE